MEYLESPQGRLNLLLVRKDKDGLPLPKDFLRSTLGKSTNSSTRHNLRVPELLSELGPPSLQSFYRLADYRTRSEHSNYAIVPIIPDEVQAFISAASTTARPWEVHRNQIRH